MTPWSANSISLSIVVVLVGGCSQGLPTQIEAVDSSEPPAVAPVTQVGPLAFVEDALVLELVDGLGKSDRAALLRSHWAALRTVLRAEDRTAAESALRFVRNATERYADLLEPRALDDFDLEILLLALDDAQSALSDSKP